MRYLCIILALFLVANFATSQQAPQIRMPNIYKSGPVAGCNVSLLAGRVAKACSIRYGSQNKINWNTREFSEAVCNGVAESAGQGITYTVMGNAKPCPGPAAIPAVHGWMCDFTIDRNYEVTARDVYYSSCLG